MSKRHKTTNRPHTEKVLLLQFQKGKYIIGIAKYWCQYTRNKIASRSVAPRPPMTDVGTETAFRLDQRKHFLKKVNISWGQRSVDAIFTCVDLHVQVSRSINMLSITDLVPKGIISGVRVQAGLYLDMLDADRSPNAVSVPAGTSQVDFEVDCPPPAACLSTGRSFDHHGKGNGYFV